MADNIAQSRPRRRAVRRKTNYREADSESDFELPSATRTLPHRDSRRNATYNEDSSSDSSSSSSVSQESQPPLARRFDETVLSSQPATRARSGKQSNLRSLKRRKPTHPENVRKRSRRKEDSPIRIEQVQQLGHIPPWQTLEYQILLKIMQFASYPLYVGPSRDTGSMRWLLDTSELCISFHEACIGALMYSPPLLPAHRAHWLLSLLRSSAKQFETNAEGVSTKRSLSMDFRKKVRRLDIEVKQLLIKKQGFDLDELISLTPLLSDLRLYHNHDELMSNAIWAQARFSKDRWSYGNLFQSLDNNNIKLKSFDWNGRFLKDDPYLESILIAHTSQAMQGLLRVKLTNLNVLDLEREEEKLVQMRQQVLNAICNLAALEDLTFQGCNILDATMLGQISSSLKRMSLQDCPYLVSDGLQQYLSQHGAHLTELHLSGNQALDLGFMANLETSCPRLEVLSVDLNFSDPTSYRDTEPLFDHLLPNGPPTWPRALRSITLSPLRSLSAEDAENFYKSLVAASVDLPHLRTLIVKTLLKDISWRDRAKMRSKWLAKFEEVFLSRDEPSSNVTLNVANPSSLQQKMLGQASAGQRQSARIRNLEEFSMSDSHSGKGNTDDEDVQEDQERYSRTCTLVLFELSDQRPAQDQWTEQDFLDDEPSDDDDWNGRDTEVLVPVYRARKYAW